MTIALLSVHVLGSILLIGPIAVAASLFSRVAAERVPALAPPGGTSGGAVTEPRPSEAARLLHRICRGYAVVGVVVPVFGIATGVRMGVLGDAWLLVSLALTIAAAGLLALAILPGQQRMLDAATEPAALPALARRLSMLTGVFNLRWAVVVVLMIARPGSTTGVTP